MPRSQPGDDSEAGPTFWDKPGPAPRAGGHIEEDTSRRFSPSKLNTYRDCPRRYRYRYVDHLRRRVETAETLLGTCAHRALERLYDGILHGRRFSLEETLQAFGEEWAAGWSAAVVIKHPEYTPENYKSLGQDCVRSYYEAFSPFDGDKTVAVEKRLGFPLEAAESQVLIEGLADRLALSRDGAFEIHDYKTTGSLPSQGDLDADWQLALYDIAVRHNWPDAREVRLVWHFLRFGKTMTSLRSAEQREALRGQVAALIGAIRHDHEFSPRKSALCDWCEYRDICPLWAHAEKVKGMTLSQLHRDEGVRWVDQYSALETKKRELREKLRELEAGEKALEEALLEYASRHGLASVSGLDGSVTISEKDEYRFPTRTHSPEAFEQIEAELKGSPLWQSVSRLDSHRLMEGYRRKEWDAEALRLIAELLTRHSRHIELLRRRVLRFHRKKESETD